MQHFKSFRNTNKSLPYEWLFLDLITSFLSLVDLLEQVSVICKFHDKAQRLAALIDKGFHVRYYVGMTTSFCEYYAYLLNRGEDSDLVQSILLLFLGQIPHFYLSHL